MKKILLFIFVSIVVLSCKKDDDAMEGQITQSLSEEQREFIQEYERVVVDDLNLKWKKEITLFLDGTITEEYRNIVDRVLEAYNKLFLDGTKITLVNTLSESNVHLYRVQKSDLADLWPDIFKVVGGSTVGYGSTSWYSNSSEGEKLIDSGRIWVDIDSGMPLLLHELGHVLGLGHSSQEYCDSSVMCGVPVQDHLSSFDMAMIGVLYHPEIRSGAAYDEIEQIIVDLLLTKEIQL